MKASAAAGAWRRRPRLRSRLRPQPGDVEHRQRGRQPLADPRQRLAEHGEAGGAGSGGDVEANLNRWAGQMEADAAPQRDGFVLGTWKVSWIEVAGTLKPSTMGGGSTQPQPGSILLGAVVEGEGGPWFFKATGPAATLDAQRESFMDLLKSGRPRS